MKLRRSRLYETFNIS